MKQKNIFIVITAGDGVKKGLETVHGDEKGNPGSAMIRVNGETWADLQPLLEQGLQDAAEIVKAWEAETDTEQPPAAVDPEDKEAPATTSATETHYRTRPKWIDRAVKFTSKKGNGLRYSEILKVHAAAEESIAYTSWYSYAIGYFRGYNRRKKEQAQAK